MSGLKRKARAILADAGLAGLQVLLAAVVGEANDALTRLRARVTDEEEER